MTPISIYLLPSWDEKVLVGYYVAKEEMLEM